MPELPDITVYVEALERFVVGHNIESIQVRSPFVLRTFDPDIADCEQQKIVAIERTGKRIIWELTNDLFLVFHLMIAGRFHWRKPRSKPSRKTDLTAFQFGHGTLLMTEASQQKRASLHVHRGRESLNEHHRRGVDVRSCSLEEFRARLQTENRTLKKALTNPARFDGIGNAYSDEILHAARLSPTTLTSRMNDEEVARLHESASRILAQWTDRLREQTGDAFPEKVTAFHPEMAVHGKFGQPCPVCQQKIERIVFKDREFNYCPKCQTRGKILADRSLSRLLKDDWPATIDEA